MKGQNIAQILISEFNFPACVVRYTGVRILMLSYSGAALS